MCLLLNGEQVVVSKPLFLRKKDYGWLRLRAAADCGPFFVPDGGLQDVGIWWQHQVLAFPMRLTTNLELFRRSECSSSQCKCDITKHQ
jgi:hypothetical protein